MSQKPIWDQGKHFARKTASEKLKNGCGA